MPDPAAPEEMSTEEQEALADRVDRTWEAVNDELTFWVPDSALTRAFWPKVDVVQGTGASGSIYRVYTDVDDESLRFAIHIVFENGTDMRVDQPTAELLAHPVGRQGLQVFADDWSQPGMARDAGQAMSQWYFGRQFGENTTAEMRQDLAEDVRDARGLLEDAFAARAAQFGASPQLEAYNVDVVVSTTQRLYKVNIGRDEGGSTTFEVLRQVGQNPDVFVRVDTVDEVNMEIPAGMQLYDQFATDFLAPHRAAELVERAVEGRQRLLRALPVRISGSSSTAARLTPNNTGRGEVS